MDEFEKLDLCGEGSYGIVWKGREIKTGKEVSLENVGVIHDINCVVYGINYSIRY